MSLKFLHPWDSVPVSEILCLDEKMRRFYLKTPANYYALADQASANYSPAEQPFHCHLAQQVGPGQSLLELGCGTAHFCGPTQKRGGLYHGADFDPELLEKNRAKWPSASFFSLKDKILGTYDIVISLYTIEHVADPKAYLKRLWSKVSPGGRMGIICPDFIDGEGIAPSIYFGRTPLRLRKKISTGRLWDAARHLYEWLIKAAAWKRQARNRPPGAFWMNLDPRDLATGLHSIDGDAIHLPRLADLLSWIRQEGGQILETSDSLRNIPAAVLKHNCYALARKPQ